MSARPVVAPQPPAQDRRRVVTWGAVSLGDGRPAVAVALTGPGPDELGTQAQRAAGAGADVLELRLDLLEVVQEGLAAPSGHCPRAGEPGDADAVARSVADAATQALSAVAQTAPKLPVLLTLRTAAEGGQAALSDPAYGATLLRLVRVLQAGAPDVPGGRVAAAALDVELERGCLAQVASAAHEAGLDVVASFHDFSGTPDEEEIVHCLARMEAQGADVAKVAVMPHDPADVARLLMATARARESLGVPLVTMAMGELGVVTRVGGGVFGSTLTFAVVPDPTGQETPSAPGQPPLVQVRAALDLLTPRTSRWHG